MHKDPWYVTARTWQVPHVWWAIRGWLARGPARITLPEAFAVSCGYTNYFVATSGLTTAFFNTIAVSTYVRPEISLRLESRFMILPVLLFQVGCGRALGSSGEHAPVPPQVGAPR